MRLSTANHEILVSNAIQYFRAYENTELQVSARQVALLFGINRQTFQNRLKDKTQAHFTHGGQNKLLSPAQEAAVLSYARKQAYAGWPCTQYMIASSITYIRRQQNEDAPPPSKTWVKNFMKSHSGAFKKYKWKPMDRKRKAAQDKDEVIQWFKGYDDVRREYSIKAQDIWNFDESGFRTACPSGVDVWIPIEIEQVSLYLKKQKLENILTLKLFFNSPENRKLNTIIETISAVGESIPLYIIIKGRRRMDNWFNNNLDSDIIIDTSDSGYTNNSIGLSFLKHFIESTQSSSSSPYKLLLFDGHDSHDTEEFKQLAKSHNIIILKFPPHLTHLMQPLDVGCFQTYKYWHKMAVHQAIRNLELNYNTASFLRDFPSFREKTFTEKTIVHAFQKAGMWPSDVQVVLKRMKTYSDPKEPLPPLITDNNVFSTPKTISHSLKAATV